MVLSIKMQILLILDYIAMITITLFYALSMTPITLNFLNRIFTSRITGKYHYNVHLPSWHQSCVTTSYIFFFIEVTHYIAADCIGITLLHLDQSLAISHQLQAQNAITIFFGV